MNNNDNSLQLLNKYRAEIMGMVALWIFLYHVVVKPNCYIPTGVLLIWRMEECGVEIFFLMLGIGMTYAVKKQTVPVFYLRRLKRLLPAYLLLGVIYAIRTPWSFFGYIATMSGYKFYTEDIHSFLWFIPAIGILYLFFPWFYKLSQMRSS